MLWFACVRGGLSKLSAFALLVTDTPLFMAVIDRCHVLN